MSVVELTRQLGAEIQKDERYLNFSKARENNDKDAELNDMIGKLNLVQLSYQQEAGKGDEADADKMSEYDKQFRELYEKIMSNPNMLAYEAARKEVDDMMNYVMQLLSLCVNGEDPATCEPVQEHSCGGSCGSCGGCH